MEITETFEYNKSIIIDKNKIESINNLVLEYCKSTDIYVETVGGSNIYFKNIDELFNFDNFKKNKIKLLRITGLNSFSRDICIFIHNDSVVFKCDYNFDSINNKIVFLEKIKNILEKSKSLYSF